MIGDVIPVRILALQLIANVSPELAGGLGLGKQYKSIGILSTDSDDMTSVSYTHLPCSASRPVPADPARR